MKKARRCAAAVQAGRKWAYESATATQLGALMRFDRLVVPEQQRQLAGAELDPLGIGGFVARLATARKLSSANIDAFWVSVAGDACHGKDARYVRSFLEAAIGTAEFLARVRPRCTVNASN